MLRLYVYTAFTAASNPSGVVSNDSAVAPPGLYSSIFFEHDTTRQTASASGTIFLKLFFIDVRLMVKKLHSTLPQPVYSTADPLCLRSRGRSLYYSLRKM